MLNNKLELEFFIIKKTIKLKVTAGLGSRLAVSTSTPKEIAIPKTK